MDLCFAMEVEAVQFARTGTRPKVRSYIWIMPLEVRTVDQVRYRMRYFSWNKINVSTHNRSQRYCWYHWTYRCNDGWLFSKDSTHKRPPCTLNKGCVTQPIYNTRLKLYTHISTHHFLTWILYRYAFRDQSPITTNLQGSGWWQFKTNLLIWRIGLTDCNFIPQQALLFEHWISWIVFMNVF